MHRPTLQAMRIMANSDQDLFKQLLLDEGLRIIGIKEADPFRSIDDDLIAISSTIAEDANDRFTAPYLTKRQISLIAIAEELGYVVAITEGLDQLPGTEVDPIRAVLRHPEDQEPGAEAQPQGQEEPGEEAEDPMAQEQASSNPATAALLNQ